MSLSVSYTNRIFDFTTCMAMPYTLDDKTVSKRLYGNLSMLLGNSDYLEETSKQRINKVKKTRPDRRPGSSVANSLK